jgi:hypothetical protein
MRLSGQFKRIKKGEKTMKRIIISMILTLSLMSVLSYGYFHHNYSCILYNECDNSGSVTGEKSTNPSLGQMISEAGIFFIQSCRDFQDFLKYLEQSEYNTTDNNDLLNAIESAVKNIETANSKYHEILIKSKSLDVNPVVMQMLIEFDYSSFQEKKNLIPSIFNEVETFLKSGNLPGVYERTYKATSDILQRIKYIKSLMESNSFDLYKCWETNQMFLKTELFGQYVSQVFSEIRKSIM